MKKLTLLFALFTLRKQKICRD